MKSRLFLIAGSAALLALSQLAVAQQISHYHIQVVPRAHQFTPEAFPGTNPPPKAGLYGLSAAFTATPYPAAANTDGSDLWPCFGNTNSSVGPVPNPDCSSIGSPSVNFPTGGVAVGIPQYTWSLSACDGTTNGSSKGGSTYVPCGQTETWFEDDTGDTSDDLLYQIVVTQGTGTKLKTLVNSGIVDFGPNTQPAGAVAPFDTIVYGDQNFGKLGVAKGPNNGNCSADANYPTSLPPTSYPIITAANKTCVDPAPGLTTITATTEVATATWTQTGSTFTVMYTVKHKLTQTWKIWLQ